MRGTLKVKGQLSGGAMVGPYLITANLATY